MHEYIHADIFRKLNTNTNYTTPEIEKFNEVYKEYENSEFEASIHHATMAELYIHAMTFALKDFHKNGLKADYDKYVKHFGTVPKNDFYEALAWEGLKQHEVPAWTNKSQEEKNKVNLEELKLGLLTKGCE